MSKSPWIMTGVSPKLLKKDRGITLTNANAKLSTLIAHQMREESDEKWKSVKTVSPKLEFYNSIDSEFGPKNISTYKCPDEKVSLDSEYVLAISTLNKENMRPQLYRVAQK